MRCAVHESNDWWVWLKELRLFYTLLLVFAVDDGVGGRLG